MPCATTRYNFLIKFVASSSVIIASFEVGKIILDMDRSVGMVRSRTPTMEFVCLLWIMNL
jgi:hypothetical protein